MNKSALDLIIGLSGAFVLVAYISFALATVGEPYSVWLWRDLLGCLK